eukprot:TRINITY_DN2397_c0_g1_i2.p1 TRINITY_DN2397_c0_g1~~TRINITY_DN2397_c0_g1_i2.p1  ORF type:complete len:739 (-),score=278.87 TRINITY_DN2397_c0_g1_i2:19-1944(-)
MFKHETKKTKYNTFSNRKQKIKQKRRTITLGDSSELQGYPDSNLSKLGLGLNPSISPNNSFNFNLSSKTPSPKYENNNPNNNNITNKIKDNLLKSRKKKKNKNKNKENNESNNNYHEINNSNNNKNANIEQEINKVYEQIEKELLNTSFKYDYNQIQFKEILGRGAYAKVFRASLFTPHFPTPSTIVAVKRLSLPPPPVNKTHVKVLKTFLSEFISLKTIHNKGGHRHIVGFYGVSITARYCCIIMEYISAGSLSSLLFNSKKLNAINNDPLINIGDIHDPLININNHNNNELNINLASHLNLDFNYYQKIKILKQIAEAINWLHNMTPMKMIHRDITCHNILIRLNPNPNSAMEAVIGDFGISVFKTELSESGNHYQKKTISPIGHPRYRPPEINPLSSKKLSSSPNPNPNPNTTRNYNSKRIDAYMYGTVMYELLTGREMYEEGKWTDEEVMEERGKGMKGVVGGKGWMRNVEEGRLGGEELREIMRGCWSLEVNQRPQFDKIVEVLRELERREEEKERRREEKERREIEIVQWLEEGEGGRKELVFEKGLTAAQRAIIHELAQEFQIPHYSTGLGNDRFITLAKKSTSHPSTTTANTQSQNKEEETKEQDTKLDDTQVEEEEEEEEIEQEEVEEEEGI